MATSESLFKTTIGATVLTTDTSITVATAPTKTSGRMRIYSDDNKTQELISYTGVSGSTLTGVTRNLSTTADPATGGTGLKWLAGDNIEMVLMHDQIADTKGTNTWTGDQVHSSGKTTFTSTTESQDGGQNVTTAERDALTGVQDGDRIYNTTTGQTEWREGGAWVANATGGTVANASETVAGKIEIATNAENGAGTSTGSTGARLVPSTDQLVKTSSGAGDENKIPVLDANGQLDSGFIANSNQTISTFTAGEDLNPGEVITFSKTTGESNTTINTTTLWGTSSPRLYTGQTFTSTGTNIITSISLKLRKNASPTDNAVFRIETISGGLPTGTLVDPNAIASISGTTLTTGAVVYTMNFTQPFSLAAGQYAIVCTRSGSLDNTNYFILDSNNTSVYAGGNMVNDVGAGWVASATEDMYFTLHYQGTTIVKADADVDNRFTGITTETITSGNPIICTVGGINANQTGLIPNSTYYLSNTAGGVSQTVGTNTVKLGRAISTTELLITE